MNWPSINASPWPPTSKCTSVIHKAPGKEARTKIRTVFFGNTFQREQTCRCTPKQSLMRSPDNSTNDHEKRYNFTRRLKNLMNVLRRSIETAARSSQSALHAKAHDMQTSYSGPRWNCGPSFRGIINSGTCQDCQWHLDEIEQKAHQGDVHRQYSKSGKVHCN